MKKLALHFSEPQTIIGISDDAMGFYKVLNIDNKILFKKKNQFVKRIESIVGAYYPKPSPKFDQIIFSLPGSFDPEKGQIICAADCFDQISYRQSYNGYSFKNNFQNMCKNSEYIYLQDPSTTFVKSLLGYDEIKYPILLIIDELFPQNIYVASTELVENWKYGDAWVNYGNWIGFSDSLIRTDYIKVGLTEDVIEKYSYAVNDAINSVFMQIKNTVFDLNTVFIISKNNELIIPDLIKGKKKHSYDLFIEPPVSPKYNFPMLGCEIYPAGHLRFGQNKRSKNYRFYNALDKVLYFSTNGKLLYEFYHYSDFIKHWKTAIKKASSQNFYKFIYEDGSINLITVERAKFLDLSKLKKEFYD